MSELIVLDNLNPIEIFTNNGLDKIIERIEKEARSLVLDISTEKGRKEIASLAYKIAKSKTYLDDLGKDLVSEWKTKSAAVDHERKKTRERLDALKEEIRQPLTEYEEKEKKRIQDAEDAIRGLENWAMTADDFTADDIQGRIEFLIDYEAHHDWREFDQRAMYTREKSLSTLKAKLEARKQYEAEQEELAKFRKAEAERLVKEHEAKIAAEAASKAKAEAERIAKEKSEREAAFAEKAKQEIIKQKEEAERKTLEAEQAKKDAEVKAAIELKAAQEKATRDAEIAVQKERERAEAEKKAEQAIIAKREADKAHKAKINNDVMQVMVKVILNTEGQAEDTCKAIITAIAKGEIPHLKINY